MAVCGISFLVGFKDGSLQRPQCLLDVILVLIWIRGSQRPLRQSEYDLRMLDGFGQRQVTLKEHKV
jgi:hypothetical protein